MLPIVHQSQTSEGIQYNMKDMRRQEMLARRSLCYSDIVASHLRIFFDIVHLSLTRLLIPDHLHLDTPRNVRTRLPGASAGRIPQSRSYDSTISRHSPTIPTLPLDLDTSSYSSYSIPTAKQPPRARLAHSLGLSCIIDTTTTIPHPRPSTTPRHAIPSFTTANLDDRSPTPKQIINSFNGRYTP
jgi:hypothetical protein